MAGGLESALRRTAVVKVDPRAALHHHLHLLLEVLLRVPIGGHILPKIEELDPRDGAVSVLVDLCEAGVQRRRCESSDGERGARSDGRRDATRAEAAWVAGRARDTPLNIDCAFNLAKFLPQNFSASSLETSPLLSKSILSKNDLSFACRASVSVPSLLVKVCVSPASSISCPRPPPMTTASGANAGLFTGLSFTAPSRETRVPLLASPTSSLFLRRICAMCQNGFCARERGRATAIGRQSEESVLSVRSRNVSRGWPAWPLHLWPSHLDLLQHGVVYGILDYRFELVRGKVGRHLFRGGHAGHVVVFKLFQVSSHVEASQRVFEQRVSRRALPNHVEQTL